MQPAHEGLWDSPAIAIKYSNYNCYKYNIVTI